MVSQYSDRKRFEHQRGLEPLWRGKVCWQRLINSLPYNVAVEFLEVNVTPVVKDSVTDNAEREMDSTGQVSDGYIRVKGRLTSTKTFYWHSIQGCTVSAWLMTGLRWRLLECKIDVPARWSRKDVSLLPLLEPQYGTKEDRDNRVVRGLLLTPVKGRADAFERVGIFSAFV